MNLRVVFQDLPRPIPGCAFEPASAPHAAFHSGGVVVVVVAQGNSVCFFCAGKWKTKKIVPHHSQHPCQHRAHSREAETQTVVLVKTACEMEPGRPHTSRNQTTRGGRRSVQPTNAATTNQPNTTNDHTTNEQTTASGVGIDEIEKDPICSFAGGRTHFVFIHH